MPETPAARIFLRPIGSPLTIVLAGLAVASLVESGLALGWVSQSQEPTAGLIVLTLPFVLQLVGCLLAYLARDGAAGTGAGVLATTWLALGLVQFTSPAGTTSGAVGLLLLASAGTLLLTAVTIAIGKPLVGLVLTVAAARFVLTGIYELGGGTGTNHAAGIVGLVACGLAGYALLAFELESQTRSAILPTFRRSRNVAALESGPDEQIDEVENEPGVRKAL
jgi:hypothetical protein